MATPSPPPPPVAGASPDVRARYVLDRHCARCHEQGRAQPAPLGGVGHILDLGALARDRRLVVPGRPDASPLYTLLLSRHVPQQVYAPDVKDAPTEEEIAWVRGWLASLDDAPLTCPGRRRITPAASGEVLRRLQTPGGAALKGIRFISLASAFNACADEAVMAERKRTVSGLVDILRTTLGNIDLPLAADDTPILAVRLGDIGWHATQWDGLAARSGAPRLIDASLIDAYATATPLVDAAAFAAAASRSGRYPRMTENAAVAALAREGAASVDLDIAAATLGVTPGSLGRMLERHTGAAESIARRLRQGRVSRAAWQELSAALKQPGPASVLTATPPTPDAPTANDRLDVGLWTEKSTYKIGELVVLTVEANRDCNLTVINVDTHGDATVLFPSDSDPDNAIKAGAKVRIPSDTEPFQLRAAEPGIETFIAVCTLNRKRLIGIHQDFETQRFSLLGNWTSFNATSETREALLARKAPPRRRRTRARIEEKPPPVAPPGPEQEQRAAIYVKVE